MIEDLLKQLIAAVNANTEALLGRGQTSLAIAPEVPTSEQKKKVKAEKVTTPAAEPAEVKTPGAFTPEELTVEALAEIGHAIIDARHAKGLLPPNGPIKALATEYGIKRVSEYGGTDKAPEMRTKLLAILAEAKK